MKKILVPRIEIHYCTQCRFILRATWIAQELLMTFAEKIGEIALIPSSGGEFIIFCDSKKIRGDRISPVAALEAAKRFANEG